METAALKSFATWARTELIREVSARIAVVLAPGSPERVEQPNTVAALEKAVGAAGGGAGRAAVADKVAYMWFNRVVALRFMDANGYTGIGVVSPERDGQGGQPEILAAAKRGNIDGTVVTNKQVVETVTGLLDGTRRSDDPQGEAYAVLLFEYCRFWNRSMPFMFEHEGDYSELLIPGNLLTDDSVLARAVAVLTEDVCQDVEVIGWLYQFYISERKDEVFAGFKKNKKAGAAEIPAATQLFTPHWIVRYLVENSLGRLWMLNRPTSRLVEQMDYYIAPIDQETDFLKIGSPEELKVIDPACGSGHMLTYAFDLLYAIYEEEGYAPSDIPGLILAQNLYGAEIDPRAGSLAAFALTMKARDRQRTFFNKQVEPNICVLDAIRFTPSEISFLLMRDGNYNLESTFWNQFENADTIGSLIRPDSSMVVRLKQHISQLDDGGEILTANILLRATRVISQAEHLSPRYSVMVANPPYMGSRNSASVLLEFAAAHYPDTKVDLYAMFIERGLSLVQERGVIAMITMESWMFIRSFEVLRKRILEEGSLLTMAHLGARAFDTIAGEVVGTTAFVVKKSRPGVEINATFIRLVDQKSEAAKDEALRATAHDRRTDSRFDVEPAGFLGINGSPLAYWLPRQVLEAMVRSRLIDDVVTFPTSPHKTGDNNTYLRRWWEVSARRVGVHERWVPYAKGGGARRWSGLLIDVVDWSSSALDFYASNSSSSLMKRDPDALEGVTYSMLTSGTNTFRVLPAGAAFDMGGPGFFPTGLSVELALAVVNSDMARMVLDALNPTLNLQVREVKQIPVPDFDHQTADLLQRLGGNAVTLAKRDWAAQEIALEFAVDPLIARGSPQLSESTSRQLEENASSVEELTRTERDIDEIVWSAAGVDPEHRGDEGERAILTSSLAPAEVIEALVSFAVGCMFGRYSLDKPGLILADQAASFQDYIVKVPTPSFEPDRDNVIPIVDGDWFEDDIVARFRKFLRVAFGEPHFEENLRFATESLGVNDIRDYFVKSFYKDHVQRYKKRPIYWLFSSPKGSFNALIYMHRYTPSTVSTVLNEYLREFNAKLEASRQHHERLAVGDGTPREIASAQKEVDRLRKVLLELSEYEHDVMYPLATQRIQIDLDDGVKANYPKFGAALKQISGLEANDE